MKSLMASAALCALLTAPVFAQTDAIAADDSDVYRNDLPETHDAVDLPPIQVEASADLPDDLLQPFTVASAGALAAQQFGNLAAAKQASGAVRDLGDQMILLNSAINGRFDALGERDESRLGPQAQLMSENVRADMEVLDDLNGEAFDAAFVTWVTTVYPGLIEAWSRLGETEAFSEISPVVIEDLQAQLSLAEAVADGKAGLVWDQVSASEGDGPTGAEGQIGERQHTPETEPPTIQSGENYEHEQVEVDPQAETASLPDDAGQLDVAPAAGELDIVNPGIVFSLLEDFSTELAQLEQASDFSADQIRVVSLDEHLSASELETLDAAIGENPSTVTQAQGAVGSQQAASDALTQVGAASDLIAFDVLDEGIVLYTRSAHRGQ